ncbi:MAG: hypothetical protein R3A78_00705 [Polyangiales bacterium]|nr:hypothetical protein [Myxococcales bacterium]
MFTHDSLQALRRRTDGTSSAEYITLTLTVALAGIGGFGALGGAMGDDIANDTRGGGVGASMPVAVGAMAAEKDDVRAELENRGLEPEDIDELEAIGVDLENLLKKDGDGNYVSNYTREDLEALGADPKIVDRVIGMDPNTIGNTPTPVDPNANNNSSNTGSDTPRLSTDEAPDLSTVDPDELLAGTGAEFTLDEISPDSGRFRECEGLASPEARYECMANAANLPAADSYELGGPGCFGLFGHCLKDTWHEFSDGFMGTVGGIKDFFVSAWNNPNDFIGSFFYSVAHPVETAKAIWSHYQTECGKGAATCAGVIAGESVFALGTAGAGRVVAGGKLALLRNAERFGAGWLAEVPGFRIAGRRLAAGPFFDDDVIAARGAARSSSAALKEKGLGPLARVQERFKAFRAGVDGSMQLKKVLPGNIFTRWRRATELMGEEAGVGRLMASQARKGRVTLTSLNFDEFFRDGRVYTMSKEALGEKGFALARDTVDQFASKNAMTRADKALQRVARNADGSFSLSDKLLGFKLESGEMQLIFKSSDDIGELLGKYHGNGFTTRNAKFRTGAGTTDSVIVTVRTDAKAVKGLSQWNLRAWKDGLATGAPFVITGEGTRLNPGP